MRLHEKAVSAVAAFLACIIPNLHAETSFASPDGQYLDWLDRSVKPGDDLFTFANGGWQKANPIPADQSYWGVFNALARQNQAFIKDLIEQSAKDASIADGSATQKVRDFYASGMDESAIEASGAAPLKPEFDRIAAISSRVDLESEIAHLQGLGVTAPYSIGQMQDFKDSTQVIAIVAQAGLGLPNRDYYLKTDAKFKQTRAEYVDHIARSFVLLGDPAKEAALEARQVMALETRLAKASMSDIQQRDPHAIYHPYSLNAASKLTPSLHWAALLTGVGHADIDHFNIAMPGFFKEVDREIAQLPLAEWKTYLRWQLIDSCSPFLSKAFVDENFRMTSQLNGAKELRARWERVLRAEDVALGFAIGQVYVEKKFPPAAKQSAVAMVNSIRDALREDLKTLAWMTPETREAAIKKLDLMELRVGYPDIWRDYSALKVDRGPWVLNELRARAFLLNHDLDKIGKPVDRNEWDMTPQTVNAYYDPSMNSINIPAGILQPPFYDPAWPAAVNYGDTGATVGHEMTHGFDDEGAQFDGHGNLKDWWTPADLRKFKAATTCVSDQFSTYTVDGGVHVQGKLVTGEAVADLGGLILAWRAFKTSPDYAQAKTVDGFTPDQQFFLAYGHSWAGSIRPEAARLQVTTNPHPPDIFRTNGTVANVPEFAQAFGLEKGSPLAPEKRCVTW